MSPDLRTVAQAVVTAIDLINLWMGKIVRWSILLLVGVFSYQVLTRWAPWISARNMDIGFVLGAGLFMLGAAYTYRHNEHIKLDVFYALFPRRTKAWMDLVLTLVVFFPVMSVFFMRTAGPVLERWDWSALGINNLWAPPGFLFMAIVPLGLFFLLLQGVAEVFRNVLVLQERGEDSEG